MQTSPKHSLLRTNILRVLVLVLIGSTVYTIYSLKQAGTVYDGVSSMISKQSQVAVITEVNGHKLFIPTYALFSTGHIWSLVSKAHPLKGEAGFTLITIPVAHGDASEDMKIASNIKDPLQAMVNAAKADGEELMVSSAYRSLSEQKTTYDIYVEKYGTTVAKQYVSPVGASEHHTGLAVDMSSVSTACADDSNSCSLSTDGAAWLAKNATKFGFIKRYPIGKEDITGVSYEPWHYRYVGPVMAKVMQDGDLTYDQVVQKLAPGYAR